MMQNNEVLCKKLGQSINDAKLLCPFCSSKSGFEKSQTLYCEGDNESTIFCPHCGLEFEIELRRKRYYGL